MEGLHAAVQVSVKSCAPETVDFFTGFELYILKRSVVNGQEVIAADGAEAQQTTGNLRR